MIDGKYEEFVCFSFHFDPWLCVFFLIPHFLWMIFGVVVIYLMVEWWTGFRFGFVDVGDN